jgi:hypothetical protein
MLSVSSRNLVKFLLLIFVFSLFVETTQNTAEARGLRGLFGRKAKGGKGGGGKRVAKGKKNKNKNVARNQNRNRNRNNDNFNLDIQPVNLFSNLNIDPTGDLQRLALFNNFAVNRNGQFFELNNGNIQDVRQPIVLSNGQVIGGALGALSPSSLDQVRLMNELGDFRTLR